MATTNNGTPIMRLPAEILAKIIGSLTDSTDVRSAIDTCRDFNQVFKQYFNRPFLLSLVVRNYETAMRFGPYNTDRVSIAEIFKKASNIAEWRKCILLAVVYHSLDEVIAHLGDPKSKQISVFVDPISDRYIFTKVNIRDTLSWQIYRLRADLTDTMQLYLNKAPAVDHKTGDHTPHLEHIANYGNVFSANVAEMNTKIAELKLKYEAECAAVEAEWNSKVTATVRKEYSIVREMKPKTKQKHYRELFVSSAYPLVQVAVETKLTIAEVKSILESANA